MTRTRRMLVRVVLVGIVALSLRAVISDSDDGWPFLAYSMFASRRDPENVRATMIVGVDARPPHGEVLLDLDTAVWTFGAYRLTRGLERIRRRDGAQAARRALAGLLPVYERWRQEGRVEGPPLKALRIVRARRPFAREGDPSAPEPAFVDPRAQRAVYVESLPPGGASPSSAGARHP